jgi:hypothetical protein
MILSEVLSNESEVYQVDWAGSPVPFKVLVTAVLQDEFSSLSLYIPDNGQEGL